jgi:ribosome biogenesis GTPase A
LQEKAVEKLMGYLFQYARKFAEKKEQEQISVAIVGFANVGKSSLINVLRNKIVVQTSSNAFLTRAIKLVRLNNSVTLIDTPGILVQGIHTEAPQNDGDQDKGSHQMRLLRSSL